LTASINKTSASENYQIFRRQLNFVTASVNDYAVSREINDVVVDVDLHQGLGVRQAKSITCCG
jgi:hypothetical protein